MDSANHIYEKKEENFYAKLKANSLFYNLPEFSPPEITFEVSEQIHRKMHEMKNDMTNLPYILKKPLKHHLGGSQYHTRSEIEEHFKDRTRIL